MLRTLITSGSVLLIILGGVRAIYVATSNDVEPYLWLVSVFLIVQGTLTLVYLRHRRSRRRSYRSY